MREPEECDVECERGLLVDTPVFVQSAALEPPPTNAPMNNPETPGAMMRPRSCISAFGVAVFFGFDNVTARAAGDNPQSTSTD